jgi:hypothetical protein
LVGVGWVEATSLSIVCKFSCFFRKRVCASILFIIFGHHLCQFEIKADRSKTTLNYQMVVEKYPNLKEEVGGLNLAVKSPLYLMNNLPSGQLYLMLCRQHVGLLSQKIKN